jgi:hypothetical protein
MFSLLRFSLCNSVPVAMQPYTLYLLTEIWCSGDTVDSNRRDVMSQSSERNDKQQRDW